MFVLKALRTRGNTKKNICVILCIVFIITCVFLLLCGFVNTEIWGILYSMPHSPKVAVIIVYVFATLQLITCVFLLIGVKQSYSTLLHTKFLNVFFSCCTGLWLYFIAVTWLHWREKSHYSDVPQFIETLILKRKRRKAIQEDQRERLGNLPAKFLEALIPQTRGIASANAL
ncbi:hypothetical protein MML48_2g00019345 [Holotrichia oblita]|uniref:Ccaat/enhancer binding protein n=2 Tax=Holotrichia oblita TaxID=644536 RepID=A0ACB9TKF5_HOLOL|nr:ccaat/enhancer binding protein [Holotrichia oblita]KAI4467160.1 hypothetical protein MML48_2g00019345 [Holotrichia oblita]